MWSTPRIYHAKGHISSQVALPTGCSLAGTCFIHVIKLKAIMNQYM